MHSQEKETHGEKKECAIHSTRLGVHKREGNSGNRKVGNSEAWCKKGS